VVRVDVRAEHLAGGSLPVTLYRGDEVLSVREAALGLTPGSDASYEHRLITIANDQQRLTAGAGGGPGLYHGEQEALRRNTQSHPGQEPGLCR